MSSIEVAISRGAQPGTYDVEVVSSAVGEASATVAIDAEGLLQHRDAWQSSLLASAARTRRVLPKTVERPLREVGEELFGALFSSPALAGRYRASLAVAQERGETLRVVLRLNAAELTPLPWEAMYDSEAGSFLTRREALLRHVPVARGPSPLPVTRPLRILAIASSPRGLAPLDIEREADYLAKALAEPMARGAVEVHWAPTATWDAIQTMLLSDHWHIIHFVGHGDFDLDKGEGVLAFVGADGLVDRVEASRFVDLLGEAEPTPRLVVLNTCASAESDAQNLFSGTAAALVRSGVNAVTAMQFEITDSAALAFARGFYTAIANGRAVDDAMRSGRVAILGTSANTFEWVTPVLYLRGDEPRLFAIESASGAPVAVGEATPADELNDQPAATESATRPAASAPAGVVGEVVGDAPGAGSATRAVASANAGTERPAVKEGPKAPTQPTDPKPETRKRGTLILAAIVCGLVAVGLGLWLWPRADATDTAINGGRPTTTATTNAPTSTARATIAPVAPLLAWQPVPGVPNTGGAGVTVHEGELWVAGGASDNADSQTTVRIYSPATGKWREGPALPEPRAYAPLVSNGRQLFLIGGLSGKSGGLRTVFRLDPGAKAWVEDAPLPGGRFSGAAAWDGTRLVFGGGVELRTPRAAASDIWTLRGDGWVRIGQLLSPREHLAAATDRAGTVWFLGGANVNGGKGTLSSSVETVRGSTVARAGSLPTPVQGLSAVWTAEYGVCAFGGSTSQVNARPATPVATTTCLDARAGAQRFPDLPQERNISGAAAVGDTVYVVGGNGAAETVIRIRYR